MIPEKISPLERIETGEPLHVGFDLDDVVLPWYGPAHQLFVERDLHNGVTPTSWTPYEEYGIEQDEWLKVLAEATLEGDLYRQPPNEGAAEAIRLLHWLGHKVHIVTARGSFDHGDVIEALTLETLEEYAIPYDTITFRARDKGGEAIRLGLDFFIDDHVRNYESVASSSFATAFLLTQPWNRDYATANRFETVAAYVEHILEMAADGE